MKQRLWVLAATLTFLAGAGCSLRSSPARTAPSTTASSDWSAVQALPPESPVRVVLRSGRSVVGMFLAADEHQIRIFRGRTPHAFKRGDVTQVSQQGARQTAKHRKIGALAGLALGLLSVARQGEVNNSGALAVTYWTLMGTGFGAWSGYTTQEETVIYRAPAPVQGITRDAPGS